MKESSPIILQTLDPYNIPLESINLIEASAGTGKSWTVTYLYLRLLLEKNLTVDQILVVTFTEAATKELRDDIRQRIVAALEAFENYVNDGTKSEEDAYQKLIANHSDHQDCIRKLQRARLSMDEAAVFTIHSFCQRCLKENAFEASLPFESELIADDSEIRQKLTDDFWRRLSKKAPKSLLFKLQQKSVTPDSLMKDIKNAIGKPYLEICGPESKEVKADKWQSLEQTFKEIMSQWKTAGSEVTRILLEDKNLNGNKFRKSTVSNLCMEMDKVNSLYDLHREFVENATKFKKSYVDAGIKAKCIAPEHPFFEAWESFSDLWEELNNSSDDFLNNTRIDLIQYLQTELPKEKQKLGVLSFDDLLLQLQQTLKTHSHLSAELRNKYKVALIDEFQDTDPIQYDIFYSIYKDMNATENAVFYVGDPKQAIYSFRGGDIHTYLKAKSDTQTQHTLKKNWRSHPDLIDAFNQLYAISDNPFKDTDIAYVQVEAGDRVTDEVTMSQQRSALNFWEFEFEEDAQSVGSIRQTIAESIAGEIAQTLNDAQEGKAKIGEKPISGGDIAILVRSHSHADTVKMALNKRCIPSVQNSRDSIFETHEANELIYLLKAIVNPQKDDEIRRALVTEFMGYNGNDLLSFQTDAAAWEEKLTNMQNWHHLWQSQGFLPMMRSLMKAENSHKRLLSFPDGERRISNILQLSELIHQSAKNNMLGMAETLRWLQTQKINADANETELRLESDDDLVKIVTIHKSKGLEYPIVYCPYVGISGKTNSDKIFTFNNNSKACLEIGSNDFDEHKEIKVEEESAEDARLLYVALTRAKYQCNVVCFTQAIKRSADKTALGWLLSNGKTIKEDKAEFHASYKYSLDQLKQNQASISVDPLPIYPNELKLNQQGNEQTLVAREFKAIIKSQAQITSFSGLTAGAHDETPDYDGTDDKRLQTPAIKEDEFPRGATAGTALHEIFENIDFVISVKDQLDTLKTILDKYGFDEKYQASAIQLVQQTLDAKLQTEQTEFSLRDLSKSQRLDEMEFYLPLARLDINKLQQILYEHLPQDNDNWQTVRDAVKGLYFDEVEGFLKGFIDLIFEHEGKYYLADYKSNTLNDYDENALFDAMAHSHYYLQYLFYSVALHRYLKQRIVDYSWETHIGGAYYLFIRGMIEQDSDGKTLQKWGGAFFDKPNINLIEALDGLFVKLEVAC